MLLNKQGFSKGRRTTSVRGLGKSRSSYSPAGGAQEVAGFSGHFLATFSLGCNFYTKQSIHAGQSLTFGFTSLTWEWRTGASGTAFPVANKTGRVHWGPTQIYPSMGRRSQLAPSSAQCPKAGVKLGFLSPASPTAVIPNNWYSG